MKIITIQYYFNILNGFELKTSLLNLNKNNILNLDISKSTP